MVAVTGPPRITSTIRRQFSDRLFHGFSWKIIVAVRMIAIHMMIFMVFSIVVV
jgi:hypothetical protein